MLWHCLFADDDFLVTSRHRHPITANMVSSIHSIYTAILIPTTFSRQQGTLPKPVVKVGLHYQSHTVDVIFISAATNAGAPPKEEDRE